MAADWLHCIMYIYLSVEAFGVSGELTAWSDGTSLHRFVLPRDGFQLLFRYNVKYVHVHSVKFAPVSVTVMLINVH